MTAYLLTWNPNLFSFEEGDDSSCQIGDEITWSCYSQKPKINDTVYLIRVGQEPRGLIAKGVVTKESFAEPDFRDPSQTKRKIRFRFEDVRLEQSQGSIPLVLLQMAFSEQKWSPQSSGIEIKPDYLDKLAKIWREGKGKHSVDVVLQWCYDHRANNEDWYRKYQQICERTRQIKDSREVLDEDLRLLWFSREDSHPIAKIKSNGLSEAELDNNRTLLKELTLDILADPSPEMYEFVCARWQQWKREKLFGSVYWAQINRFFAAANPIDQVCAADNRFPEKLGKRLRELFLLSFDVKGSWSRVNKNILDAVTPLLNEDWDPLRRNIALWNFYQTAMSTSLDDIEKITCEIKPQQATCVNTDAMYMTTSGTNTIFYGPPGTGKTFHVIEAAVKAAKKGLLNIQDREQLKTEYDALLAAGRIRFVTFHQSFSYEEFIEGLRAKTDDAGQISYCVEPGIFKQICTDATFGQATIDSPLENAIEAFKLQLELETRMTLTTKLGKPFGVEFHGNKTFRAFPESTGNENLRTGYPVAIEHIWNEYQGINRERIYNPSYVKAILNHLIVGYGVPAVEENISASSPESFVLIIDEINRGNISKIFGELITLIEPSKRAGQKEALSVQLPYSGDTFTVPANLHIIGTMNTADRSLATMDTALRRRFDFIEMMPDYRQLDAMTVKGINIGALLRTLNDRIEYLYDREHTLGHAFFMSIAEQASEDDQFAELAAIFKKKILPLLQEYFFEDWSKIRLILSDNRKGETALQFVTKKKSDPRYLFGDDFLSDELSDACEVYAINDDAFVNPDAYLSIISQ